MSIFKMLLQEAEIKDKAVYPLEVLSPFYGKSLDTDEGKIALESNRAGFKPSFAVWSGVNRFYSWKN